MTKLLGKTAGFRRVDLHWCLTLDPSAARPFRHKPEQTAVDTSRMLADLQKTATILEGHLGDLLGLRVLGKNSSFQFFSYLFNLEEWAAADQLHRDTAVDRQIVKSPVAWHSDHLIRSLRTESLKPKRPNRNSPQPLTMMIMSAVVQAT